MIVVNSNVTEIQHWTVTEVKNSLKSPAFIFFVIFGVGCAVLGNIYLKKLQEKLLRFEKDA